MPTPHFAHTLVAIALFAGAIESATARGAEVDVFEAADGWTPAASVEVSPDQEEMEVVPDPDGATLVSDGRAAVLSSRGSFGDCIVRFSVARPKKKDPGVFLMGRYEVRLEPHWKAAWQDFEVHFRAPRLNEYGQIRENPLVLRLIVDGEAVQEDVAFAEPSRQHPRSGVAIEGRLAIRGDRGAVALRDVSIEAANFEALPEDRTAHATAGIVDYVDLGKQTFLNAGCTECHAVVGGASAVKTGPNLFGLFGEVPRLRAIREANGTESVRVRADETYFRNSLRNSVSELAIVESGGNKGKPYEPTMPPSPAEVISPLQLDALYRYLQTLNEPGKAGPPVFLGRDRVAAPENPMTSYHELLVTDEARLVRARVKGNSSRALFVGRTNGFNYSFDPRVLSVLDVWWGGFLNQRNEHSGRANQLSSHGTGAQLVHRETPLLAPLDAAGAAIDFSYRENVAGDRDAENRTIHDTEDFLTVMARIDAEFLGYRAGPGIEPEVRFRVGENAFRLRFLGVRTDRHTKVEFRIDADLKTPQSFAVDAALRGARASAGELLDGRWTLSALGEVSLRLTGTLAKPKTSVWRPALVATQRAAQPIETEVTETARVPAGYEAETILPPKDVHGRTQLFESTGLAIAEDGTAVIATRTAGIWRLRDDEWRIFSDIVLDPMGVWIEDASGACVVVAQKPELTRIRDTDGDGFADTYKTLCDDYGFHENYHSYNHGPVRDADGNYYFALNLAHGGYKAASPFMGSTGGYRGWLCRWTPDGEFQPWASGLRSPAGLSIDADGQIWYTENQGEFNGTSKLHRVREGAFYGSTNSLIDLPGMVPDAPENAWDEVKASREVAAALFPHAMLANAPGHPAWDTTNGGFAADTGRMFVGDQTLSCIFTVHLAEVDGREQAVCIPFAEGMPSGVMRIAFDARDRMLVGQTGRGWRAVGGKLDGLVRIRWDGTTPPVTMTDCQVADKRITISLSQPLTSEATAETLAGAVTVESWFYQDTPGYGSPTHDRVAESFPAARVEIGPKRRVITLHREETPEQTDDLGQRAFRIVLPSRFVENGAENSLTELEAFVTTNR